MPSADRTNADPARGDINDYFRDAVGISLDPTAFDGPRTQGDGAVAARGGEAVFVPEQDTKVRAVIVSGDDKSAKLVEDKSGTPPGAGGLQFTEPVHRTYPKDPKLMFPCGQTVA